VAVPIGGNRNSKAASIPRCATISLAGAQLSPTRSRGGVDWGTPSQDPWTDLTPLRHRSSRQPVYLREIWPTPQEVEIDCSRSVPRAISQRIQRDSSKVTPLESDASSEGDLYQWDRTRRGAAAISKYTQDARAAPDIRLGSPALAILATGSPPTYLSRGSIAVDSPPENISSPRA